MEQKLHTNSQLLWLTKLMPFDYIIEYKRRVENKVADALSRVTGVELMSLVHSTATCDLFQAIIDSWHADHETQALIHQLQTSPGTLKQYNWCNNQFRRKVRLVVGNDHQLRI